MYMYVYVYVYICICIYIYIYHYMCMYIIYVCTVFMEILRVIVYMEILRVIVPVFICCEHLKRSRNISISCHSTVDLRKHDADQINTLFDKLRNT